MSNETKSLYERIVKRLNQGRRVILKKSDGSWSVCVGMNGSKIKRTEFEADSMSEAIQRANRGSHLRLSTKNYLDGEGYGDIILFETITAPIPQLESSEAVDLFDQPIVEDDDDDDDDDCCYESEDEDDDYDYPAPSYSEFTTPKRTPTVPPRSRSILKKITLS